MKDTHKDFKPGSTFLFLMHQSKIGWLQNCEKKFTGFQHIQKQKPCCSLYSIFITIYAILIYADFMLLGSGPT